MTVHSSTNLQKSNLGSLLIYRKCIAGVARATPRRVRSVSQNRGVSLIFSYKSFKNLKN